MLNFGGSNGQSIGQSHFVAGETGNAAHVRTRAYCGSLGRAVVDEKTRTSATAEILCLDGDGSFLANRGLETIKTVSN
jgi:hypothetical protein